MNEQALKDKIKQIAAFEGRVFNHIWRDLILERLLVRLSRSPHKNRFIFKGGLLLARYISLGRETKDADFLIKESHAGAVSAEKAFQEICRIDAGDGFSYTFSGAEPLQTEALGRFCHRLNFHLTFGKMRDRAHVDVAGGDVVKAKRKVLKLYQYKGRPLFEKSISLSVYPAETIFAEKLESVVSRSSANTRMKDYHDLILLCREKSIFDFSKLKKEIEKIFKNRRAGQPAPLRFSVAETEALHKLWKKHCDKLSENAKQSVFPSHIKTVIEELNNWLLKNKIF